MRVDAPSCLWLIVPSPGSTHPTGVVQEIPVGTQEVHANSKFPCSVDSCRGDMKRHRGIKLSRHFYERDALRFNFARNQRAPLYWPFCSFPARSFFILLLVLSGAVFLSPGKASADAFRDFIVYPYETPEQGEITFGTWQTLLLPESVTDTLYGRNVRNSSLLYSTYVLEFGVTDWWTLGTYVDFAAGAGQTYSYLQTRAITTRLRLPRIPDFIDPAVQIEYWAPGGGTTMQSFLDIILIAEKKIGRFIIDINPTFFFPTDGSEPNFPPEFAYAAGLYYLIADNVNAGIEAFGETGAINNMEPLGGPPSLYANMQQQYIFQSWNFAIGEHIDWNIGVGAGLTPVSAPFAIKTIFEFHFKPLDFNEKEGKRYEEEQNIH